MIILHKIPPSLHPLLSLSFITTHIFLLHKVPPSTAHSLFLGHPEPPGLSEPPDLPKKGQSQNTGDMGVTGGAAVNTKND